MEEYISNAVNDFLKEKVFFLHAVQLKLEEKSVEENKNSYEYKVLVKFFKK